MKEKIIILTLSLLIDEFKSSGGPGNFLLRPAVDFFGGTFPFYEK